MTPLNVLAALILAAPLYLRSAPILAATMSEAALLATPLCLRSAPILAATMSEASNYALVSSECAYLGCDYVRSYASSAPLYLGCAYVGYHGCVQ